MILVPNPQLDLAFKYVHSTNKHIFLTGKAGTGKTTFLHQIKEQGWKRLVVTAPTGVAAINAGGMTLHSFFQLPFGLHIPGAPRQDQRHLSRDKIQILRTLDLLIIDEISMVRADLLDAVDDVLRRYRGDSHPFGGVQLLMIGDLHQLPPVVKPDDWQLLRPHYKTPYFFGSHALGGTGMVTIELKHIYRQSDPRFIELLNRVRNSQLDAGVLEILNARHDPHFQPGENGGYITLTSHNAAADQINGQKLEALPEKLRTFRASISGNFPETAFPTEEILEFKKGAQVMFVKNDPSPDKRFFNGKIGRITAFGNREIHVQCEDEPNIAVAPLEWQNIRYSIDEETKEIKAEILGTFTQYPLRLAWAVTIHKSQGLTFDRVVIDAGAAFASGQVYVALSRCRTFDGIVLSSRISPSSVKTDSVVRAYTEEAARNAPNDTDLRQAKREYQETLLRELFNFAIARRHLQSLNRLLQDHRKALSTEGHEQFKAFMGRASAEIFSLAEKFVPQLQIYFSHFELPEENEALRQRLQKAGAYFSTKFQSELLPELKRVNLTTDDKAVRKAAKQHLQNFAKEILTKCACFRSCQSGFSTAGYTQARTNAELDIRESAETPSREVTVPKDTPHPDLYARLLVWRSETAKELGTEAHEVLPIRSLEEVLAVMPRDRAALKRITGIGKGRLKRYGGAILTILEDYRDNHSATREPSPSPNTKQISRDLYKSGKTIAEIAAARHLTPGTIEGHLAHFIALGELAITDFLTQKQTHDIALFFSEKNTLSLAEAKAHFGELYSYGQLRMVAVWVKARREAIPAGTSN